MIPYAELDRALARWKAKAQGGMVELPPAEVESAEVDSAEIQAEAVEAAPSEGMPMVVDEAGSVPQPVASERTGEIDLAEIETYDDELAPLARGRGFTPPTGPPATRAAPGSCSAHKSPAGKARLRSTGLNRTDLIRG